MDKKSLDLEGIQGVDSTDLKASELRSLKDVIESVKESQDTLFQIVHNKGLDVGLPKRIRDDINELIAVINRLDNVWENQEFQEKRKNLDNDVAKLINKGDVVSAFLKVSEELRRYKEDMIGVRMFMNMVTFKLNHLENELTKHDKK